MSCQSSKESSTGLTGECSLLTRLIITMYRLRKRTSWLIVKRFSCFWHFALSWQSQQNVNELKHRSCFTQWFSVLPPSLRGALVKFMNACNNNHVLQLIWRKTEDWLPFAGLSRNKIPDFRDLIKLCEILAILRWIFQPWEHTQQFK